MQESPGGEAGAFVVLYFAGFEPLPFSLNRRELR